MRERLRLRPELRVFGKALQDRLPLIAGLEDERFARPRAIEPEPDGRLTVISDFVPGRRLADVVDAAADQGIVAGLDAGLGLLLELLPAISRLHDAGVTHGALAPGRVMVTAAGQIVLVDTIYGEALERLQLTRKRLWVELRLAFPSTAGAPRFDKAADLTQAALTCAALIVGRPLRDDEYPDGLAALKHEIVEIASIRASKAFADGIDKFFAAALPLPNRKTALSSADEAAIDLRKLLRKEVGITTCRNAMVEFFQQVDTAEKDRVAAAAAVHARQEADLAAREEAERREQARVEADRIAREDAERKAREDAQRRAKEEAERKARDEAERKAREEAERKAREEAEQKAREEAQRKAREEAERKERERLEAERKAREEAERKAREEAERKVREQAERKAREEAERKAREEAERKAREEAERKAREEAERRVREEAERKAREEAERKARQEAERKAREEAERKAREEAERKAREEAERKAREEAERKAREEAERKAREEAERKAREEAERKAREEAERKAREEAERKARAEAERKAREEAERKAREEAERRARERAEQEARERAELEARERAEQEALERIERAQIEAGRLERERIDRERAEREREERETRERIERARVEAERAERERIDRERAEREQAERDRIERERAEVARREREKVEQEARERAAEEARVRAEEENRARAEREARERAERETRQREEQERALAAMAASAGWLVPPDTAAAFEPATDEPPPAPSASGYPIYAPSAETESWTPELEPPAAIEIAPVAAAPPPAPGIRLQGAAPGSPIRLKDDDSVHASGPARAESRNEPEEISAAGAYQPFAAKTESQPVPWKLLAAGIVLIGGTFAVTKGYLPSEIPTPTLSRAILPSTAPKKVAPPPPAAGSTTPGQLSITTQPDGIRILLDGKVVGTSPLTLEKVPPGRHVLTLQGAGGSIKRTIKVEPGQPLAVDVPVFSGFVEIGAPFIMEVAEGGKTIGTTDNPIILGPGRHTLHLQNKDLGYSATQSVDIEPGETTRLPLDPRGNANINAVPWAEVYIDGEKAGETPLANVKIRLGVREIVFKNPQFPERKVVQNIKGGEPTTITVDFTKDK